MVSVTCALPFGATVTVMSYELIRSPGAEAEAMAADARTAPTASTPATDARTTVRTISYPLCPVTGTHEMALRFPTRPIWRTYARYQQDQGHAQHASRHRADPGGPPGDQPGFPRHPAVPLRGAGDPPRVCRQRQGRNGEPGPQLQGPWHRTGREPA